MFDFSTFPTLTTERLILRAHTDDDADIVSKIWSGEEMMRYISMDPLDTPEKALGLLGWFRGNYESQEGVQWGYVLKETGALIGSGGFYHWERDDRKLDIGYHVLPQYWGKGYATEAARAVCKWCFDALDVHRIQADCTDGNIGSESVMLKLGFKFEGLWRESCWEHGRFVDIKQFGLLRREFIESSQ